MGVEEISILLKEKNSVIIPYDSCINLSEILEIIGLPQNYICYLDDGIGIDYNLYPNAKHESITELVEEFQSLQPLLAKNKESMAWELIRSQRNVLLAKTDWTQGGDASAVLTNDQIEECKEYRDKLRKLPENFDNSGDVVFPDLPNYLEE